MDTTAAPSSPAGEELLAVVAAAEAALRSAHAAVEARAWAATGAELVVVLQQLARARRVGDAAHLAAVRSLSPEDAAAVGFRSVAPAVTSLLRQGPARSRRDVAAAAATDPQRPAGDGGLPALGAALADGAVGLEHVDVAVRALEELPVALRRESGGAVDAFLAAQSRQRPPADVAALAEEVLDRLDPDRHDRGHDADAFLRRSSSTTTDSTGMLVLSGQLDPVAGAQLKAAVEHCAAPAAAVRSPLAGEDAPPGEDAPQVVVVDDRTPGQRRADALAVLARQGMAPGAREQRGGEPPRVIVTTTLEQLAGLAGAGRARSDQTGPLSPDLLVRLAEAASLQPVVLSGAGDVLRLGRAVRCSTPAQRRALLARDGGCVVTGCDAPPAWLEVHHVVPWAQGGATDVDNGVLACGQHHTAVTVGVWEVRVVGGLPQVRGPGLLDPLRRWVAGGRRPVDREAQRFVDRLRQVRDDPPDEPADAPAWAPSG